MLRRLFICGLLIALPMLMLYPVWWNPTSAGEDDVVYYWPLRVMVARQVQQGQWPAWNPGEAGGVPLMGDPQSGVLYPSNWLFLVVPPGLAYSLCVFLGFATAGGGAYLYLRQVKLATPAAVFGALAFAFSGFLVGHRVHLGLLQSAALLPWGLWCIERIRLRPWSAWAWLAPVYALTLAAGHWPTAISLTLVWGVYLLVRGRPLPRAIGVFATAAAVGLAVIAPQVLAVLDHLHQTARAHVPYSVMGDNSFLPICGVLVFFPFLMGCRTQNFFPQPWWGPWHLCEMLGYVGLVTLVLAGGAIWRLYRKPALADAAPPAGADSSGVMKAPGAAEASPAGLASRAEVSGLTRLWTWLALAAGVWALGYYNPLYWLIYKIPVLGSVRCPARMLLVIDFALSALAALAIHALATGPPERLVKALRRGAVAFLPACMAAALALMAGLALGQWRQWWDITPILSVPGDGSSRADCLIRSVNPLSPAVYVPFALTVLTAVVVVFVLKSPPRRVWLLPALLLADLFFLTRFVDVPGRNQPAPDPEVSPAAAWLRQNAPDEPFRVLGLTGDYHVRATELLQPKVCASLGFETISYYGPLAPDEYSRLFGFRPWGINEHWRWLIRRNHLLSLFNVRYVLAADEPFRKVIESVEIPTGPPAPAEENLLKDDWTFSNAQAGDGVIRLKCPTIWEPAWAQQKLQVPEGVYRIGLDVRAPAWAGNFVSAEYVDGLVPGLDWGKDGGMRIDIEQLTPAWRHFEWTFQVPQGAPPAQGRAEGKEPVFRLYTPSERPIEVRDVVIQRADWERPINFGNRLAPGRKVYVDRTPRGLPPIRAGDPPVHIYENLLHLPRTFRVANAVALPDNQAVIEELRWRADRYDLTDTVLVPGPVQLRQGATFTSENLSAKGDAGYVSADGLGAVRPGGEATLAPGGAGTGGLAGALVSALAAGVYAGVLVLGRRRKPPASANV